MKNKMLLSIVVVLSLVLSVVICLKEKTDHSFFNEKTIKIKTEENKVEELNLEEYLIGVLAAEMPASFEEEALKAQAVASRSYALYKMQHTTEEYDILTDITNQAYITPLEMQKNWQQDYEKYYQKIKNAVKETEKEIMTYQQEVIEAFYFSMSNGATEDSLLVFNEKVPYIESVESKWDNETIKNFEVTTTFSKNEFCKLLTIENCNQIQIENITFTPSHRVQNITINQKNFSGITLRKLLNLRSTDMEITLENEKIQITTKGYGHGVGMSQYGANGMAKEGYSYKDILNHYYKDITIQKMV